MKIIHKKLGSKDHTCNVCGTEFDWHKDAWRYGKMEYKTITEQKAEIKFCSTKCKDKFLNAGRKEGQAKPSE